MTTQQLTAPQAQDLGHRAIMAATKVTRLYEGLMARGFVGLGDRLATEAMPVLRAIIEECEIVERESRERARQGFTE